MVLFIGYGSGFWVMEMTKRARMVSAFIMPSRLYEWLRIPFSMRNVPKIYHRMVDNALYGYLIIGDRLKKVTTRRLNRSMC